MLGYIIESIIDRVSDPVVPVPGCVVYCDLAFGLMEHSGIYVGNGKIVHLNRHGEVRAVSPKVFLSGSPALKIQVSCFLFKPAGSDEVAERARSMVGTRRNYHVLHNNCHKFSYGCLTGAFDNPILGLAQLKTHAEEVLEADNWRVWDR